MPMTKLRASLALLAAALLLAPTALRAQEVAGEVVDAQGAPVPSARVVLLGEDGAERGSVLADTAGRFRLRAPGAGSYRLRAERVGFASIVSPPLRLAQGETLRYRLSSQAAAVSLEGITVRSGEARCRPITGAGPATATLWEEASKALSATVQAAEGGALRYDLSLYRRGLDPQSLAIVEETRETRTQAAETPFASEEVGRLLERGFVYRDADSVVWEAPDAAVLLSDEFLETHCFHVEESPVRPEWVGLGFRPVRGRRVPDVAGVLWLDRATAELRRLEYRYANTQEPGADHPRVGGTVEFERLPTGRWIVRRWYVRMPEFGVARAAAGTLPIATPGDRVVLVMLREEGGEVLSTSAGTGAATVLRGGISGVVQDPVSGRGLRGARVFVSGTQHEAETDAAGEFSLPDLPEGTYTVSFTHPSLAHSGIAPPVVAVEVRAGETPALLLELPSEMESARVRCPDLASRPYKGVVLGRVLLGTMPQPGARLHFTWRRRALNRIDVVDDGLEVRADAEGFYAACGVPQDVLMHLETSAGGRTQAGPVILRGAATLRHDVRLQEP